MTPRLQRFIDILREVDDGTKGSGWESYSWAELPQLSMSWHPDSRVANRGAATFPYQWTSDDVQPLWHGLSKNVSDGAIAKVREWLGIDHFEGWMTKVRQILIVIVSQEEADRILRLAGSGKRCAQMMPERDDQGGLYALIVIPLPHQGRRKRGERKALETLLIHELEHVPQVLRFAGSIPLSWKNLAEACAEHRAQELCGLAISMEYTHRIGERLPFGLFNEFRLSRFERDGYHLFAFVEHVRSRWADLIEDAWQSSARTSDIERGAWHALDSALRKHKACLADAWESFVRALVVPDASRDSPVMQQLRKHASPWLPALHIDCGSVPHGNSSTMLQPFGAAFIEVRVPDRASRQVSFQTQNLPGQKIAWRLSHLLPGSAEWNPISFNAVNTLTGGNHCLLAVPVFDDSEQEEPEIFSYGNLEDMFSAPEFRYPILKVDWA
jgi:hypothetical protein